jgi:tetratricopeptide (TPR) repeat protein
MKRNFINYKLLIIGFGLVIFNGCSRFLEIGTPTSQVSKVSVFSDENTIKAAIRGIHQNLLVVGFGSGGVDGVSIIGGLSADEIRFINSSITQRIDREEIQNNTITPRNTEIEKIWASFYTVIYGSNAILEGLAGNQTINQIRLSQLKGEVLFLRAFTYFYLINLFGDIPLVLSTNFRENAILPLSSVSDGYRQVLADLEKAYELLPTASQVEPMVNIGKHTAIALLARTHLYLGNWKEAEDYSSILIDKGSPFSLETNLDRVFLKGSSESIWSQPIININTSDAETYITRNEYFLNEGFQNIFSSDDERRIHWIKLKNPALNRYIPFKYKSVTSGTTTEYSVIFRLSEQFLIRSEARLHLGKSEEAISDLDAVRRRAGLSSLQEDYSDLNENMIGAEIVKERRKELFCEWGHRWFDLKRHNMLHELAGIKSGITVEDGWFPIPEKEVLKNPKWQK